MALSMIIIIDLLNQKLKGNLGMYFKILIEIDI